MTDHHVCYMSAVEGGVEGGEAAEDESVRYKGGHIPSKSFQMLQMMTKDEPDPGKNIHFIITYMLFINAFLTEDNGQV